MRRKHTIQLLPTGALRGVRIERGQHEFLVTSSEGEGSVLEARVAFSGRGSISVLIGDASYEARLRHRNGEVEVEILGERFAFRRADGGGGPAAHAPASGRTEVKAPMPGKVIRILRGNGEAVQAGEGVLVFEAMKMQNEIRSPRDGILVEMAVQEGAAVEAHTRLFTVEPSDTN